MLYSTFYLDDKLMGLPIPSILEIGRSFKIHPVRGAPRVIDGLINLRGKVVTIINSGLAFDVNKVESTEESRIYILKNNSELKEVEDSDFFEVYCSANLSVCEQRDTKGLYAKARAGQIKDFTGISSPYEEPESPEIEIDTGLESLDKSVQLVIDKLIERISRFFRFLLSKDLFLIINFKIKIKLPTQIL